MITIIHRYARGVWNEGTLPGFDGSIGTFYKHADLPRPIASSNSTSLDAIVHTSSPVVHPLETISQFRFLKVFIMKWMMCKEHICIGRRSCTANEAFFFLSALIPYQKDNSSFAASCLTFSVRIPVSHPSKGHYFSGQHPIFTDPVHLTPNESPCPWLEHLSHSWCKGLTQGLPRRGLSFAHLPSMSFIYITLFRHQRIIAARTKATITITCSSDGTGKTLIITFVQPWLSVYTSLWFW